MKRLSPDEWLARLTGPDRATRKRAATRVCELMATDGEMVGVLEAALLAPNGRTVFWTVSDLGALGPRAEPAVPVLIGVLAVRPEFGVRQGVVSALAAIAPADPAVRAAVLGAFADADPSVRCSALQATIRLEHLSAADLGALRGMGADPDPDVARWSEVALRNIALRRGQGRV